MDDEHGVFWVVDDHQNVLEFHKDLYLFYTAESDDNQESKITLTSPEEAEAAYRLFFAGRTNEIKALFRQ